MMGGGKWGKERGEIGSPYLSPSFSSLESYPSYKGWEKRKKVIFKRLFDEVIGFEDFFLTERGHGS